MEDNRTPILFHTNAPWVGTGYGAQGALFGPLLAEKYRLAFSAFHGLRGSRIGWSPGPDVEPLTVYPGGINAYGNDVVGAHARHWFRGRDDGFILLLTDPWVIDPKIGRRVPVAAWAPVDHDPLMQPTNSWFKESGAFPIAMSRFGKRVLEDAGLSDVQYVPHGYDPDTFKPGDMNAARDMLKIPRSAFVVSMVAANVGTPSRKCFAESIEAFSIFQQTHKDAILYLHTKLEHPEGEDLPTLLKFFGVRAMTADQYGIALGAPAGLVAMLFQASNVLLNPARGEGFGVTTLESQACGTPCIVNNFSAMPEVADPRAGNIAVGGTPTWTHFHSLMQTPNVEEIVAALETMYADTEDERAVRSQGVQEHVLQYRADTVLHEHFLPALAQAELEFGLQKQLLVEQ